MFQFHVMHTAMPIDMIARPNDATNSSLQKNMKEFWALQKWTYDIRNDNHECP